MGGEGAISQMISSLKNNKLARRQRKLMAKLNSTTSSSNKDTQLPKKVFHYEDHQKLLAELKARKRKQIIKNYLAFLLSIILLVLCFYWIHDLTQK